MAKIPDALLAEIRAALPIAGVIGRSVRLLRAGAGFKAACPIHGGRSMAFHVYPDHFHCYSCGAHGDVFRWVMTAEGCDFRQAVLRCAADAGISMEGEAGERRNALKPPPAPPARPDTRLDRARDVWARAVPIGGGDPAARYLAGRGLWPLPEGAELVLATARLRYPPDRDDDGKVLAWPAGQGLHPCMVARVSAPGRKVTAVHVTFLGQRDGAWRKLEIDEVHKPKHIYGALPDGAAIRLAPPAEAMGVAEGIETALAARALTGIGTWSSLSTTGMEKFMAPALCRDLTIFADRDKPQVKGRVWKPEGAGLHSARVLLAKVEATGRAARIRVPVEPHGDYADVLAARMEMAA